MYANEEEELEILPPVKIFDLMDLYDRRNYVLYKFLKENPWQNDLTAYYQHRPVQATYIEMDSG